jgi:hypothetical protein
MTGNTAATRAHVLGGTGFLGEPLLGQVGRCKRFDGKEAGTHASRA